MKEFIRAWKIAIVGSWEVIKSLTPKRTLSTDVRENSFRSLLMFKKIPFWINVIILNLNRLLCSARLFAVGANGQSTDGEKKS